MQSSLYPDTTDSFQFSFNGSLSAFQFGCHFAVGGPLKFEQHDFLHRFIRYRIEQCSTTFRDFSKHIGRLLVATDRIDPSFPETGLAANVSSTSFLPILISPLCGDFSGSDNGQQAPQRIAILGFDAAICQTTAETMESTIRRVAFVVTSPSLRVEFLKGKLMEPHGNMLPQFFGCLFAPIGQLVNPARDRLVVHVESPVSVAAKQESESYTL
jgi:hypothetical protein